MVKDICVVCDAETENDIDVPVDSRLFYIDGVGELCSKCFERIYRK